MYFNVIKSFVLGLALIPLMNSLLYLYFPYIFDINILGMQIEFLKSIEVGYVVTEEDVISVKNLEESFSKSALLGLIAGLIFGGLEFLSVKKKNKEDDKEGA